MNLIPDERKALARIDRGLCGSEPQLAAKFAIFHRLTAADGPPPDEDLIASPRRPAGPPLTRTDVRGRDRHRFVVYLALLSPLPVAALLVLL